MDNISPTFNPVDAFDFEITAAVSEEFQEALQQEVPPDENEVILDPIPSDSDSDTESEDSQPQPDPNPTPIVNAVKITIGGEEIEYDDSRTGTGAVTQDVVLFKKTARVGLTDDKKNDLFEKITKTQHTKFDLVSMTLSEEDKLDDTYNLGILVTKMKNHLLKYDCIDVFTILEIDEADETKPTQKTLDLFADYSIITEAQVAASNKWYRVYPTKDYFSQNLQLTLEFLENNCTEQLWEKVLETHDEFKVAERGGPLALLIMMRLLQSHTDSAVQNLLTSVKNLKIFLFEGENVGKVVSLIRGAYRRIKAITTLPEEFPKWVLTILQSSTVPVFNSSFAHLQLNAEVVDPLIKGHVKPIYQL